MSYMQVTEAFLTKDFSIPYILVSIGHPGTNFLQISWDNKHLTVFLYVTYICNLNMPFKTSPTPSFSCDGGSICCLGLPQNPGFK